jgi:HK97 gp10 family phage protein
MASFGEYIIVWNLLPELAAKLEKAVDAAARKAAFDIQAKAQALAPVDTGFLKNSIYTITDKGSTYGNIAAPPEGAEALAEVSKPAKPVRAVVAVAANYGVFVEFGSVHGPAQPYLTPAADAVMPSYQAALEKLEDVMMAASL